MVSGGRPAAARSGLPVPGSAERCVLVFTRAPRREAQAKGIAGAELLFERLRDKTLAVASSLPGVALVVAGAPGPFPLPIGAHVLPQRGRSFGARLENAFADARALGFQEIVAVGTDSPGLRAGDLAAAFAALRERNAVLGPAADGGIYLVGIRGDTGSLLSGVHWRTSDVFAELLARAPEAGVLPETLADLDGRDALGSLLATPGLDPEIAALIAGLFRCRPAAAPLPNPGRSRPAFAAASPLRGPPALLS